MPGSARGMTARMLPKRQPTGGKQPGSKTQGDSIIDHPGFGKLRIAITKDDRKNEFACLKSGPKQVCQVATGMVPDKSVGRDILKDVVSWLEKNPNVVDKAEVYKKRDEVYNHFLKHDSRMANFEQKKKPGKAGHKADEKDAPKADEKDNAPKADEKDKDDQKKDDQKKDDQNDQKDNAHKADQNDEVPDAGKRASKISDSSGGWLRKLETKPTPRMSDESESCELVPERHPKTSSSSSAKRTKTDKKKQDENDKKDKSNKKDRRTHESRKRRKMRGSKRPSRKDWG